MRVRVFFLIPSHLNFLWSSRTLQTFPSSRWGHRSPFGWVCLFFHLHRQSVWSLLCWSYFLWRAKGCRLCSLGDHWQKNCAKRVRCLTLDASAQLSARSPQLPRACKWKLPVVPSLCSFSPCSPFKDNYESLGKRQRLMLRIQQYWCRWKIFSYFYLTFHLSGSSGTRCRPELANTNTRVKQLQTVNKHRMINWFRKMVFLYSFNWNLLLVSRYSNTV